VLATQRWREALAAWRIPDEILAGAEGSPWVLPRHVFTGRVDRQLASPTGASYLAAWQALDPPGSVLDVGAGAGAASLPLAPRATEITAVDADAELLAEFARRGAGGPVGVQGVPCHTVHGRWPEDADRVPHADVVVCHHVVYNAPELAPFVTALTDHARRLVVVETSDRHPLTELNPLWLRFHGISRPTGPTAEDALAVLAELGIRPRVHRWRRRPSIEHPEFATMVDVTRRRLCLPRGRTRDVADALTELGYGGGRVADLGSSGDDVTTFTWTP